MLNLVVHVVIIKPPCFRKHSHVENACLRIPISTLSSRRIL